MRYPLKNKLFILLSAFCFLLLVFYCYAQSVSSHELINKAKEYDGWTVIYSGEVIGDVMKRGNFAWVNVNDGENAIGVWAQSPMVKDITYTGSYRHIGDTIEVTGIFHRACPEHGGDLDIHALEIRKIAAGRYTPEPPNIGKRNAVIILLGVLCLVWILTRFKNK